MRKFTHYHHLRISDNDTIDLLHFDGKLRFKRNNDTYGSVAAKTAKDDRAAENYVKRETVEKLKKKGAGLEERDDGWMIVEMANDKVEDSIERRQQERLKLKLGDDGYIYTAWFTVYHVKGFDIILATHWVCDINGTYHIDHQTNYMWITQGDIPWEDRDKAAHIHYLCGLRPETEPDNDIIKESARTMGIEIFSKKYLCRMNH
jgi:hypothetical protein